MPAATKKDDFNLDFWIRIGFGILGLGALGTVLSGALTPKQETATPLQGNATLPPNPKPHGCGCNNAV